MKKFLMLILIFAVISVAGIGISQVSNGDGDKKDDEFTIVTSFYPTYIAVKNIADGIDGVKVVNLTENHSGCLHDYQLTTNDMRKLEGADVFVMNGGGMESFLEDVVAKYPDLTVIDASKGITLLEPIEGHDHEHEEDAKEHTHEHEEDIEEHNHEHEEDAEGHEHDHEEDIEEHDHYHGANAHVWMNPEYYLVQLANITSGLIDADSEHAKAYQKNEEEYASKVDEIKTQLLDLKVKEGEDEEIIIFHEAFAYLADYLGYEVVYSLDLDDESGLSAGKIAKVIDEVQKHDIKNLFTETEYADSIATNIADETGANVSVLSSLTSDEDSENAYIEGMQNNIDVLKSVKAAS